jgi:hypothetical protein
VTRREAADHPAWEGAGRLGLAAKGVPYVLIAWLALEVALGSGGKAADRQGALRTLADDSLGRAVLIALALGFAGYALWRFAQAFLDRDREGDDAKGLAKRAGDFAKGVLYAGFCYTTVELLAGWGGSSNEKQQTADVFALPLGRELVFLAGVGFLFAASWNAYRAVTRNFMKDMRCGGRAKTICEWVGVGGHAARGAVWAIVGWFLIRAAWDYEANKARGLDGALRELADRSYGSWLLGVTAAGLALYGAFCFLQARYRDV